MIFFFLQILSKVQQDGQIQIQSAGISTIYPGTCIRPHCGPTNKCWDIHVGLSVPGTQFTCFTSTKVRILTQKLHRASRFASPTTYILSFLALLVPKYEY